MGKHNIFVSNMVGTGTIIIDHQGLGDDMISYSTTAIQYSVLVGGFVIAIFFCKNINVVRRTSDAVIGVDNSVGFVLDRGTVGRGKRRI